MISGVLCVLLGEALMFGSIAVLAWFAFVFALNAVYFPLIEEPDLRRALRRGLRGLPCGRPALGAAAAPVEPLTTTARRRAGRANVSGSGA